MAVPTWLQGFRPPVEFSSGLPWDTQRTLEEREVMRRRRAAELAAQAEANRKSQLEQGQAGFAGRLLAGDPTAQAALGQTPLLSSPIAKDLAWGTFAPRYSEDMEEAASIIPSSTPRSEAVPMTLPPEPVPYSEQMYGLMAEPQDLKREGRVVPGGASAAGPWATSHTYLPSGLESALDRRAWLEGRQQEERQSELGQAATRQRLAGASINPAAESGANTLKTLAEAGLLQQQGGLVGAQTEELKKSPEAKAYEASYLPFLKQILPPGVDPQNYVAARKQAIMFEIARSMNRPSSSLTAAEKAIIESTATKAVMDELDRMKAMITARNQFGSMY